MNDLEQVLKDNAIETIGDVLYEQNLSIVVDWREASEDVVFAFAQKVDGQLNCEWTADDDLALKYKSQTRRVGLQQNYADLDRTLRAIHEIVADDYEIRVLKSSLESDTFEFVIAEHAQWQKLDAEYDQKIEQLFVLFTDKVKFGG